MLRSAQLRWRHAAGTGNGRWWVTGGVSREVRVARDDDAHEMGKWWQNPDVVSKLGLSDSQVSQLNQVFYNHKMKLIDYGADMEKQDLKLQTMLDADQPDEGQVNAQVDQVLSARGKLEREFTAMNLDLRKQLSLEQWRQLKTIRGAEAMPGDHFFFKQKFVGPGGPGMPGGPDGVPPPPPPPGLD